MNTVSKKQIPADIIFAPDWWHHHTGITFDEDFFYHPAKRVESEKRMEQELYERFGKYDLGGARNEDRPEIGAVHLAAGYLVQEMLGCKIEYTADGPPAVIPANLPEPVLPECAPFESRAWKRLETLMGELEKKYGYLCGDVNWGGILNIALDLRGQALFLDMSDAPDKAKKFFHDISLVLEEFTRRIFERTGTTSISVTRLVKHLPRPVMLHSQCSHTMISEDDYRQFMMRFDEKWCREHRPYGIHFCGKDPHRFAQAYGELPSLDFLDVGWGGNVELLRKHLPDTFFSIRLDPVSLKKLSPEEIREIIHTHIQASADPGLTGLCCINMDKDMPDENVNMIFETAHALT